MLLKYLGGGIVQRAKETLFQVPRRRKDRGSPAPKDHGGWDEDGKCSGHNKQKKYNLTFKTNLYKVLKGSTLNYQLLLPGDHIVDDFLYFALSISIFSNFMIRNLLIVRDQFQL